MYCTHLWISFFLTRQNMLTYKCCYFLLSFFWNTNSLRIFAISFSYLIYHFCRILWMNNKKYENIYSPSPRFSSLFSALHFFIPSPCVCVCWQVVFLRAMKLHIPHLCFPISYISYYVYLVVVAAVVVFFSVVLFFLLTHTYYTTFAPVTKLTTHVECIYLYTNTFNIQSIR